MPSTPARETPQAPGLLNKPSSGAVPAAGGSSSSSSALAPNNNLKPAAKKRQMQQLAMPKKIQNPVADVVIGYGPRITANPADQQVGQMAKDMIAAYVGMEVVRGPDWIWGDQDRESPDQIGKIIEFAEEEGWVRVKFGTCVRNYRAGFAKKVGLGRRYDLRIAIRNTGILAATGELMDVMFDGA